MARADLIVKLFRSGVDSDLPGFRKAAEAMIAEERAKKHNILADRLERSLVPNGNHHRLMPGQPHSSNQSVENLVFEITPEKRFEDLLLAQDTLETCRALVEEQHRAELLRSYCIEPRHRVLLTGIPGNGKTTLAEALAYDLAYPLIVIRYEKLIGSFLGETSSRLQAFICRRGRRQQSFGIAGQGGVAEVSSALESAGAKQSGYITLSAEIFHSVGY